MPRTRRLYPSDLTDQEWVILQPLLASSEKRGRPPKWPARRVAEAVFYLGLGAVAPGACYPRSTLQQADRLLPLLQEVAPRRAAEAHPRSAS